VGNNNAALPGLRAKPNIGPAHTPHPAKDTDMAKSKFFRVATEGATTDGRSISRDWITQMAKNYSPKTYGARVNLEHFRGILPDGPFRAYGDITALKTEEVDGKLTLLAQIDPTTDLVELAKKRQKIYTSMEVDPDFAKTGEAYLVGLAVTDSPASLGTDMLQFCAQAKTHPFADRKLRPEDLFSEAVEFQLELEAEAQPNDEGKTLFSKVKELLTGKKQDGERLDDAGRAIETIAESQRGVLDQFAALKTALTAAEATIAKLTKDRETDAADLATLRDELGRADKHTTKRPPATGSSNAVVTDC
jgi:hypothetical protein